MLKHQPIPEFLKRNTEIELPFPGAVGWLLQGREQQVVFVEFKETVAVPEHSHAEQWEFALAGQVELRREGRSELFKAGDNFFVPAGQPHAATVYAGYMALIVFNEAGRYKPKIAE